MALKKNKIKLFFFLHYLKLSSEGPSKLKTCIHGCLNLCGSLSVGSMCEILKGTFAALPEFDS